MAEYTPSRYAEILMGCIENQTINELNLAEYLNATAVESIMSDTDHIKIGQLAITSIKGIDTSISDIFSINFSTTTIDALSKFAPFIEAKNLISKNIHDPFYENPSAPKELIPTIIGSTHTAVRFSNYSKEKE